MINLLLASDQQGLTEGVMRKFVEDNFFGAEEIKYLDSKENGGELTSAVYKFRYKDLDFVIKAVAKSHLLYLDDRDYDKESQELMRQTDTDISDLHPKAMDIVEKSQKCPTIRRKEGTCRCKDSDGGTFYREFVADIQCFIEGSAKDLIKQYLHEKEPIDSYFELGEAIGKVAKEKDHQDPKIDNFRVTEGKKIVAIDYLKNKQRNKAIQDKEKDPVSIFEGSITDETILEEEGTILGEILQEYDSTRYAVCKNLMLEVSRGFNKVFNPDSNDKISVQVPSPPKRKKLNKKTTTSSTTLRSRLVFDDEMMTGNSMPSMPSYTQQNTSGENSPSLFSSLSLPLPPSFQNTVTSDTSEFPLSRFLLNC